MKLARAGVYGLRFAADRVERKAVSGYVFTSSGGAISWRSKKQDVVAQSTVEAEYVALSFAVRETLWLQRISKEFRGGRTGSVKVLLQADNQGAMEIAKNDVFNEQSKHIDVKYHFLRNYVRSGVVKLQYIPTGNMVADIMTKALAAKKYYHLMNGMGMHRPEMSADKHFEDDGEY